jgi:hypothetical protein
MVFKMKVIISLAVILSLITKPLVAMEEPLGPSNDRKHNPVFFKLTDKEGQESYILFTQHNLPLDIVHPAILDIFNNRDRVNKVSCEWTVQKCTNREIFEKLGAYDYDAYRNTNFLSLPDEIYKTFGIDKASAMELKPWAVYAYYRLSQQTATYKDSMDALIFQTSRGKGYAYEGLESQEEVAQLRGLPQLSREQVLDLFKQEEERTVEQRERKKREVEILGNPELYRAECERRKTERARAEEVYLTGDLLAVEEAELKEENKILSVWKGTGARNTLWVPRMINQHQTNRGKCFFAVGSAHAPGLRGLLYQLKSYFSMKRMNAKGLFCNFDYLSKEESPENGYFKFIEDEIPTAGKIVEELSPLILQGQPLPETQIRFLEGVLSAIPKMGPYEKEYFIKKIEDLVIKDQSHHAQNTLAFLNSHVGRKLQELVWGERTTLSFVDLLKRHPQTRKLFMASDKESEKAFRSTLTSWLFDQAQAKGSLAHLNHRYEVNFPSTLSTFKDMVKISAAIEDYCKALSLPLSRLCEFHTFDILISEGCFSSWSHLFHHVLPLDKLTDEEVEKLLEANKEISEFLSLTSLYEKFTQFLMRKEEETRLQDQFFEEREEKIKEIFRKAKEDSASPDDVYKALELCISGKTYYRSGEDLFGQHISTECCDRVIFKPDPTRANALYEHGKQLFNGKPWILRKFDGIMERGKS